MSWIPWAGGGAEKGCPEAEAPTLSREEDCIGLFAPHESSTKTVYRFVGEGKGSYLATPTYNYVGANAGSFQAKPCFGLEIDFRRSVVKGGLTVLGMLSAVILFFAVCPDVQSSPPAAAAAPEFDCLDTASRWEDEQVDWCCKNEGRGCRTTSKDPFDCFHGFSVYQTAWGPGQRAWCCDHYRRGCEATTTPVPFDCQAGFPSGVGAWAEEKTEWCCMHERVACRSLAGEAA
mmetsp:Transcript_82699/g.229981  ORF Transcript_82699/g.229981 Transcript_82699/m.229981 type:complete len:232 (-) Transcript_82699:177-872(-)